MQLSDHMLKPEKTLLEILHSQQSDFVKLLSQSRNLARLNKIVQNALPEPLKPHCQVIGYQSGCLMIAVDSPEWNHHLRFAIPEMISELRVQHGVIGLVTIKSRIQPLYVVSKRTDKKPTPPPKSLEGAQALISASSCIEDQELKAALQALATVLEK